LELFLSKLVNHHRHCLVNVTPIEERRIIREDLERVRQAAPCPGLLPHNGGPILEVLLVQDDFESEARYTRSFSGRGCTYKHLAFSANELRMLMMTTFLRDRATFRKVGRI
jgi:hypothetical protein